MEKKNNRKINMAFTVLLVIIALVYLFGFFDGALELERMESIKKSVLDAAHSCYCIEGVYPRELSYLEEHYGLFINHKKYIVSYDCMASNRRPVVKIFVNE